MSKAIKNLAFTALTIQFALDANSERVTQGFGSYKTEEEENQFIDEHAERINSIFRKIGEELTHPGQVATEIFKTLSQEDLVMFAMQSMIQRFQESPLQSLMAAMSQGSEE